MIPIHPVLLTALIFSALFFPGQTYGQKQENQLPPGTLQELQDAIEKVMKETATPAVGIAMVEGDCTVWVSGLGMANIEKNTKATENTMFRIGSTSKMFVSLAILQLQEEGRLSLKDKVRDLAPEIEFENPWRETAPILVEHLLEHTTGWDDMHLTEYALNDPKLSLKEGLDYHPHSRTSRWMPGTRMSYTNSGPPVAAYIIEKITGQRFEDYIQANFFQPMGMENMTYLASETYKKLGATLYLDKEPQKYWHISVRPSGAINASPKDVAKMLRFFINRGRVDSLPLISEASLKRMETPSTTTGAKAGLEYGYGLSNYSSPYKKLVYRSHNGGVNGGLTDFAYLPEHRIGYAVMINSGNGNALHRITQLIREFQTSPFGADTATIKRKVTLLDNHIAGYYVPINPRMEMSYHMGRIINVKYIRIQKNGFIYTKKILGGWRQQYVPISNGKYISPETGKVSLVQVKDPLVGAVIHEGSEVLLRISPLLAIGQLVLGAVWVLYLLGSILIGSIFFIGYWRGKKFKKSHVSLGLWPFLASLFFLLELVMELIGSRNLFELFGKVSFVSVSIMILTILFALASSWSVINLIKERKATVNKTIYWHLAILSGLHLLVTGYLLWHGLIGVRTWS